MIKLIKHDLKSILPDFLGLYLALVLLAGLFPVFMELSSLDVIIILYFLAAFGTLITIAVLTYVAIFNLFYKRLFSHQAYLTLSLPGSTRMLLLSKLISSALLIVITTLVMLFSFGLSLLTSSWVFQFDWNVLTQYFEMALTMGLIEFLGKMFLAITPLSISSTLYSLSLVLFIITFVHTSYVRKNRVMIGILTFIAISFVVNRFMSTFLSIEAYYDQNIVLQAGMGTQFDFANIPLPWTSIMLSSGFFILMSVALFELSRYLMDRKLEIE